MRVKGVIECETAGELEGAKALQQKLEESYNKLESDKKIEEAMKWRGTRAKEEKNSWRTKSSKP